MNNPMPNMIYGCYANGAEWKEPYADVATNNGK